MGSDDSGQALAPSPAARLGVSGQHWLGLHPMTGVLLTCCSSWQPGSTTMAEAYCTLACSGSLGEWNCMPTNQTMGWQSHHQHHNSDGQSHVQDKTCFMCSVSSSRKGCILIPSRNERTPGRRTLTCAHSPCIFLQTGELMTKGRHYGHGDYNFENSIKFGEHTNVLFGIT